MENEVIELPAAPVAPAATTTESLLAIAAQNGADVGQMERLMALAERMRAQQVEDEKRNAEKAYNAAFAEFKAEAVRIIKNRPVTDGPLRGRKYAELFAVVNAITPALSRHGLSAAWKLTKDERDWIEVTCTVKHTAGHSESVSMGGPPDAGGAKNAIQARASTVSYLERYTLKAITGLSEQEEDDDGAGAGASADFAASWVQAAEHAATHDALKKVWADGLAAVNAAKDRKAYDALKAAVVKRGAELDKKEAA